MLFRFRTMIAMSTGFAVGYLAGAAAGRERYEQLRSMAGSWMSDLGLDEAGKRLSQRGEELARASGDVATSAVDATADRAEQQLREAQERLRQGSSMGSGAGSHAAQDSGASVGGGSFPPPVL